MAVCVLLYFSYLEIHSALIFPLLVTSFGGLFATPQTVPFEMNRASDFPEGGERMREMTLCGRKYKVYMNHLEATDRVGLTMAEANAEGDLFTDIQIRLRSALNSRQFAESLKIQKSGQIYDIYNVPIYTIETLKKKEKPKSKSEEVYVYISATRVATFDFIVECPGSTKTQPKSTPRTPILQDISNTYGRNPRLMRT